MKLANTLAAWGTDNFAEVFKHEVLALERDCLPLQQGLRQSSHVSDSDVHLVILNQAETADALIIKTGIFYSGVIAGSCCADDPTPLCEENEYCELEFVIDRQSAQTRVRCLEA